MRAMMPAIATTVLTGMLHLGGLMPCEAAIVEAQAPSEAIRSTMNEIIHVLQEDALKAPDRAEDRRRAVEEVVKARVSYEEMAKRALGSQWTLLDDEQRKEFVELFVSLLRDSFANHVTELVDDKIVYLGEQRYDASFAEVHTQLSGPKVDTSVDFRVINRSGDWLVYDVVVEGASIVYNYRSQFARVIKDVSYMGLLKQLKDRTVTLKRFETSLTQ